MCGASHTWRRPEAARLTVVHPTDFRSLTTSPTSEDERRAFRKFRFKEPVAEIVTKGRWRPPTPPVGRTETAGASPIASPARVEDVTPPSPPDDSRTARTYSAVRPPPRAAAALALLTTAVSSTAVTGLAFDGRPPPAVRMDLPLMGMPIRFDREFTLPVPPGFVWERYDVVCLHEHSGSFRESWASHTLQGRPVKACSVAERRTITPPSLNCAHFLGDVFAFLAVYPHPIPLILSHVNCGDANFASWKTWGAKILSGAMRSRAEEVHYFRSLGALAGAEQPPTSHELTLGPADFQTAAELHGGKHTKTYLWFVRGLAAVQPTLVVPETERIDFKASVIGTAEEKMLQRSFIERQVADAHTATWISQLRKVPDSYSRPAAEPCESYEVGRERLHHNFVVFSARYAPRVDVSALADPQRSWCAVIIIPMHAADGTWALCPSAALYGARHNPLLSLEDQARTLGAFLGGGVPPALACIAGNTTRDFVVLMPHAQRPLSGADDDASLQQMLAAGHEHVWCRPGALSGVAYFYVGLALRRVDSARRAMAPQEGVQIGMWELPRPVISSVAAHEWNAAPADDAAPSEWASFLARDREAMLDFKTKLTTADNGDGVLIAIADLAICAADLASEICPPEQGLPDFDHTWLRQHPYPARTPSVSASWLAEIPPQPLPVGCPAAISWVGGIRPWARRMICRALDTSADHGVELWRHGVSSKPRGEFLCLGRGAAYDFPHADGVGTWHFFDVLWRRRDSDGWLEPMDFGKRVTDHKDIEFLFDLFSPPGGPRCTDQELLSMLSRRGGAVLKVGGDDGPPRQIRIDKNLSSLDSRIRQVATPTLKLFKAGLYRGVSIRDADGKLDADGPCPLLHVPGYVCSTGGADKGAVVPGGPPAAEARRVGNDSSPHTLVKERNSPHGEANGPVVLSKNELTGPKCAPPGYYEPGYTGPKVPWPNKEHKQSAPDLYGGCGVLRAVAIDGKLLVSHASDVKWMFWQIYLRGDQYWLCTFLLGMEVDGTLKAVMVEERVLNMGLRPASKVASRFSEEWVQAWRRNLRAWVVREWLPRQSAALQQALAWRRDHLGVEQADPFWAAPYTDDYIHIYLDTEVGVAGVHLEVEQAGRARLWMSPKYALGTVAEWTGGRAVLNGGFGTLPPAKRTRAITDCVAVLNNNLTRERYESHNSFLVHADLWLNFPPGTLKGTAGPLKAPGFDSDIVVLTPNATAAQEAALYELQTRPCASFLCSTPDAARVEAGAHRLRVEFSTDSCSDVPAPRRPHICWTAHGTMGRFLLQGRWLAAHITLTEGCGPALAILELAPSYPADTIVLAADATAATAAQLNRSQALLLQMMMRRLKVEDAYRNAVARLFVAHCAGFANILSDAGSRDLMDVVSGVAAAYGLRMRFPATSDASLQFMADVITWVAEPAPERGIIAARGHFILANADAPSFRRQPGDIYIDRSHPELGNFLHMRDESQRAVVCRGFDDVWHGRATVQEAANTAGVEPVGRTAAATLTQRHAAAADIAVRVMAGEELRGVCHCAPRKCHGRTIVNAVMKIVYEALSAPPPQMRAPRRRAPPFGSSLMLATLLLTVVSPVTSTAIAVVSPATSTAIAVAAKPAAVHPLFACLVLGMPHPFVALDKSPSPLGRRRVPPIAPQRTAVPMAVAAAAMAVATVVTTCNLSPPRKRRALFVVSPEMATSAPKPPSVARATPLDDVSEECGDASSRASCSDQNSAQSSRQPFQPASPGVGPSGVGSSRRSSGWQARLARDGPRELEDISLSVDTTSAATDLRARWSPQPKSAASARAAAAGDLAATLANDSTKYAIMQGRPEALADLCEEAAALRRDGAKKGTDKRDTWGYNKVSQVCESAELGSPVMRPRVHEIDAAGRGREAFWAALLVMKLIMVIAPCARNAAKGITQGKPASALQAVYGYYNVQRDCGRFVPDFKLAAQHLRGLNERFKRLFGLGALVKRQVQPFSLAMLLTMISLLTSGGGIPGWSAALTACMCVLIPFECMTGTRKDEFTKDGAGDNDYLRRSNFQWMDGEREVLHTPENIRNLPARAFLRGQAGPSKCDRYLQTWGARMQWFQRNDANPLNFASAFRRWELAFPCPVGERAAWAAFSPTGTAAPFSPSAADKALHMLMVAALGAAETAKRSFHAFRVTLASALRGIPRTPGETTEDNDGVIQMCLRWSSIESVRTYSRINRYEYARYTELGSTTCALSASDKEPLPPIEAADVAVEIDDTISSMVAGRFDASHQGKTDSPPGRKQGAAAEAADTSSGDNTTADTSPLTRTNAPGRRVLIPAIVWPDETCLEHDGSGWEGVIRRCSARGATVSFTTARAACGRPYGDARLDLAALQPF